MKTIKFRGVTPQGEMVYGDLTHYEGNTFINDKRVDPYRVDQFAGYDENGDEVFENDTVISHGKEYKVKIDFCYGVVHNIKLSRKK
jgi:hypothetical protein